MNLEDFVFSEVHDIVAYLCHVESIETQKSVNTAITQH